jgi:hypothetical protein
VGSTKIADQPLCAVTSVGGFELAECLREERNGSFYALANRVSISAEGL